MLKSLKIQKKLQNSRLNMLVSIIRELRDFCFLPQKLSIASPIVKKKKRDRRWWCTDDEIGGGERVRVGRGGKRDE